MGHNASARNIKISFQRMQVVKGVLMKPFSYTSRSISGILDPNPPAADLTNVLG